MRIHILYLLVTAAVLFSGCATPSDSLAHRLKISYYDRNSDGKVDQEKHQYRGVCDADWELRDDDFDGRYEKKIEYSLGVLTSAVDIPVPTNVRIETKP